LYLLALSNLCCPDTIGLEILSNFDLLERAVDQFDARFTLRALRAISSIRKLLEETALTKIILRIYLPNDNRANILLKAIGTDVEQAKEILHTAEKTQKTEGMSIARKTTIPEIDIYISILVQVC
jgi:26S proteasome regulatory subunit N3